MLEMLKQAKKRILFIIFLLLLNSFITFSGFVAYTSDERIACDILKTISTISVKERNKTIENIGEKNTEIVLKFLPSYEKKKRCSSLQEFLINQLIIIYIGSLTLLIKRKS